MAREAGILRVRLPKSQSGVSKTECFPDDFWLVHFKARWLDPALGRFAQAHSLIPGSTSRMAKLFTNALLRKFKPHRI